MSRIRSSGSRPEKALRALIRDVTGLRPSYNVRSLPGSPDIVVRSLRLVVMMDGCYWHGCPLHGRIPKTNPSFWAAKISGNKARDKRVSASLRSMGWALWRVWEHDLKGPSVAALRRRLRRRLLSLVSSSRTG